VTWMNTWWSQVSETATHGLQITVAGMALVFFTLGLIILSLLLLTRLPGLRSKDQSRKPPEPPEQTAPQADTVELQETEAELAQVAAIAAAMLCSHRARAKPRPQGSRNAWRNYGRAHQLGL
jgi:Na+-transporting methylmalonyl-CoA/oxaloacetate decarboxylase gamma subunit